MVITYHGSGFVKIQHGDLVIALNPIGRESGEKPTRFGADLVLVGNRDPRYAGVEAVSGFNKEPFVIDGPGEYEHSNLFIKGVGSAGPAETLNTIFTLTVDGIRLCHLGNLAAEAFTPEVAENIGALDLVFVPIGEAGGLSPKEAIKIATGLEPKLIIPVGYTARQGESLLKTFFKEAGVDKPEIIDKLTLKKKDLEGREAEVVVIASF